MIDITRALKVAQLHLDNNMVVSEADAKLICRAIVDFGKLRVMSAAMAEDDGLWFQAETCAEAYLQQELRRLCAAIEGVAPDDCAQAALAVVDSFTGTEKPK